MRTETNQRKNKSEMPKITRKVEEARNLGNRTRERNIRKACTRICTSRKNKSRYP